jgi:hypothetical protein
LTGGPLDNNSRLKSHLTFGGSIFLCTFVFLTDSYPFIHAKFNAHDIGGTSSHFDHHLLKDTWVPEGALQSLNPEQICKEKLCVETLNFDHHLLEDRWVTEGTWQKS